MGRHDWKIENAIQMRVWVRVRARKLSSVVNSMGKLGALDTENVEPAINQYTMRSNAQRVMEQKYSLI